VGKSQHNLQTVAPKGNQAEETIIAKETISTAMQNLHEAFTGIAKSSNKERVFVEEFQLIGFAPHSAVALVSQSDLELRT
jgi:ATP-dependent Zn protease